MMESLSGVRIPDFAGVALVDILANGVATLVIIIAISISARFEHESQLLDQVAETAVVLSREFSDKLIINKLSGNAPARLHDYENSPLDQYLDVRIMPIFELHKDFVRDLYTARLYPRGEMLLQDTHLDARLKSFNATQLQRIRVDIYDVHQFYVFMSVLRSHDIRISHWHFMGAGGLGMRLASVCPAGVPSADCARVFGAGGDSLTEGQGAQDLALSEKLSELMAANESGRNGKDKGAGAQGKKGADGKGGAGNPAEEDPLFGLLAGTEDEGQGGPQGQQGSEQLPPSNIDIAGLRNAPDSQRYGGQTEMGYNPNASATDIGGASADTWHSSVMRGMGQSPGNGAQPGETRPVRMRMRLASPQTESRNFQQRRRAGAQNLQNMTHRSSNAASLHQVLAAWLNYLREIQRQLDANVSPWGLMSQFRDKLSEHFEGAVNISEEDLALITPLTDSFNEYWPDQTPPNVDWLRSDKVRGMALAVPVNTAVNTVNVLADTLQGPLPKIHTDEQRMTLRVNMHPSPYQGLSTELESYGVLLMPPEQTDVDENKWRTLAYINPAFDDIALGFVYGAISGEGELLLDPESNHIEVNGSKLEVVQKAPLFSTHSWMILFFTALVVGILLLARYGAGLWYSSYSPTRIDGK